MHQLKPTPMFIAEAFSELLGAAADDGDVFAFNIFLCIKMAQDSNMIVANNYCKPIA